MRLNGVIKSGLLTLSTVLMVTGEARAADMPLYDAPDTTYAEPQQPLEFGTGWYLRGDGAYAEGDHPAFKAATATFDRNATGSSYAFGLGAGYKLNSFFRVDITADYLDPFSDSGHEACGTGCDVRAKTYVWRWDGLANTYLDLGTWYGVTPYLGGGAGVAGNRQVADTFTTFTGASNVQTTASRNAYNFAWAAMAGFSYAFAPHAMIDVGYRYLDLGRTTIQLQPLASTQKNITEQQVRVGIRYMVD